MNRIFKYLKILGVVLFIIFEDIIWRKLAKPLYEKIKSFKVMDVFAEWVNDVEHRYALLFIFILPVFFDILLSYLFGVAMANAMILTAIGIYVLKAVASVMMFLIFKIGKKKLTSFYIIRVAYYYILKIKASSIFRNTRKYLSEVKNELRMLKEYLFPGNSSLLKDLKSIYINIIRLK